MKGVALGDQAAETLSGQVLVYEVLVVADSDRQDGVVEVVVVAAQGNPAGLVSGSFADEGGRRDVRRVRAEVLAGQERWCGVVALVLVHGFASRGYRCGRGLRIVDCRGELSGRHPVRSVGG